MPGRMSPCSESSVGVGQQRVDQRAPGVPRRGVDHQPRRLIHHQHVGVFVDHRAGPSASAAIATGAGAGNVDLSPCRRPSARALGLRRAPVDQHLPRRDQLLPIGARQVGAQQRQHPVQPLAGLLGVTMAVNWGMGRET